MQRRRLKPLDRSNEILTAAVALASRSGGYLSLTRAAVAARAQCSEGLVSSYFNTMQQMRRAVMRHAVKHEVLSIVAQGLATGDPVARKAPEEVRQKASAALAG